MSTATTANSQSATSDRGHRVPERRGILFIVSAPSGTGKTTLCKQIAATVPGIWHSISYTTRQPRPGEEHGREYFFIEEKAFQGMIERNEFLEYAHVYGHWYGTPRKALMDKMEQGIDVLLEIDVQGAMQIKKRFEDGVYIFILPPSMEALRARLQSRASDSPEEIHRRLQKVKEEVWSYREYYYIVRNDDLAQSLRELQCIFIAERLKTKRLDMQWLEQTFILEKDTKQTDRDTPSTT
jgi:guanylate kinase